MYRTVLRIVTLPYVPGRESRVVTHANVARGKIASMPK